MGSCRTKDKRGIYDAAGFEPMCQTQSSAPFIKSCAKTGAGQTEVCVSVQVFSCTVGDGLSLSAIVMKLRARNRNVQSMTRIATLLVVYIKHFTEHNTPATCKHTRRTAQGASA